MRHSQASHAIAAGMQIEMAQQNLGHASLATTTVHVTTDRKRRLNAVEKFWKKGAGAGSGARGPNGRQLRDARRTDRLRQPGLQTFKA